MKKLLKVFLTITMLVILTFIIIRQLDRNIVIETSNYYPIYVQNKYNIGDTVQPLLRYDLTKGEWKSYIVISPDDFASLSKNIKKGRCFSTSDLALLNQMKNRWRFKYTGGDMTTVSSQIYLLHDNKIVFKCGIIIDENMEGLQSKYFGWIEAHNNEITAIIKQYQKIKSPIILL